MYLHRTFIYNSVGGTLVVLGRVLVVLGAVLVVLGGVLVGLGGVSVVLGGVLVVERVLERQMCLRYNVAQMRLRLIPEVL